MDRLQLYLVQVDVDHGGAEPDEGILVAEVPQHREAQVEAVVDPPLREHGLAAAGGGSAPLRSPAPRPVLAQQLLDVGELGEGDGPAAARGHGPGPGEQSRCQLDTTPVYHLLSLLSVYILSEICYGGKWQ